MTKSERMSKANQSGMIQDQCRKKGKLTRSQSGPVELDVSHGIPFVAHDAPVGVARVAILWSSNIQNTR